MLKFEKAVNIEIKEFLRRKRVQMNTLYVIEYKVLKIIMENEESSLSTYAIKLKQCLSKEELIYFQKEISKVDPSNTFIHKESIIKLFKMKGLNTEDRRENYKNKVAELGNLLLEAIDGNYGSYYDFKDKYQQYSFSEEYADIYQKHIPNGVLVYILDISNKLKELKKSYPLIESISFSYYKFLITDFEYIIGREMGIIKRKNALDILEDTKVIMNEFSKESIMEFQDEDVNELEKLKFERDAYKSSLVFIENNFNDLKEKIEEEAREAKKISIGEFFTTLNSEKYGKFLDKVPYTEELLTKIRKEKLDTNIPSEVRSVIMFIKQVIKFIKDSGIEPIEEYNKTFLGTADEIANMNYIGEPFFKEHEKKELKVQATGYKYNDIVISIPTVLEVNN